MAIRYDICHLPVPVDERERAEIVCRALHGASDAEPAFMPENVFFFLRRFEVLAELVRSMEGRYQDHEYLMHMFLNAVYSMCFHSEIWVFMLQMVMDPLRGASEGAQRVAFLMLQIAPKTRAALELALCTLCVYAPPPQRDLKDILWQLYLELCPTAPPRADSEFLPSWLAQRFETLYGSFGGQQDAPKLLELLVLVEAPLGESLQTLVCNFAFRSGQLRWFLYTPIDLRVIGAPDIHDSADERAVVVEQMTYAMRWNSSLPSGFKVVLTGVETPLRRDPLWERHWKILCANEYVPRAAAESVIHLPDGEADVTFLAKRAADESKERPARKRRRLE